MVLESPVDERIQATIDKTHGALRASLVAREHQSEDGQIVGGHYRGVFPTGSTTVLNAGDAVFSLRYAEANKVVAIQRIQAYATILTAFGAAQEVSLDGVKMNGFTAPDTGGTSFLASINGGSGRKKASHQPSALADIRAAGAAALGAGTGTADGTAFGFVMFPGLLNALGSMAQATLYDVLHAESALILGKNEGLRLRIGVTQGAAGVVRFVFVVDWAEIPLF